MQRKARMEGPKHPITEHVSGDYHEEDTYTRPKRKFQINEFNADEDLFQLYGEVSKNRARQLGNVFRSDSLKDEKHVQPDDTSHQSSRKSSNWEPINQKQHIDTTSLSKKRKTEIDVDTERPSLLSLDELPFILEAPHTLSQFNTFSESYSSDVFPEIVKRIIVSNDSTLQPSNVLKMDKYLEIIFLSFLEIADSFNTLQTGETYTTQLIQLDILTKSFVQLAQTRCIQVHKLIYPLLQKIFHVSQFDSTQYPPVSRLLILQFLSKVYPTTDYFHKVLTPSLLYINRCLIQCNTNSVLDTCKGLYLCSLCLSVSAMKFALYQSYLYCFNHNHLSTQLEPKDGRQS